MLDVGRNMVLDMMLDVLNVIRKAKRQELDKSEKDRLVDMIEEAKNVIKKVKKAEVDKEGQEATNVIKKAEMMDMVNNIFESRAPISITPS